nr:IQ and AAA domain-containing protein 1-like [Maniola hyperantus]
MYNQSLFNTIIFILICVIMQVTIFVLIIYSSAMSALKLEQVVILSRHNVRTPVSKNLGRMTPQFWPHWKEKPGFLTEKGFLLEGYMGKYFYTWLNKEGLLPKNCPSEEDFYVYSNTMQRTLSSAQAFVTECYPNCNITIHHADIDKPDLVFTPLIHNSTAVFKEISIKEMEYVLSHLNLNKSFDLMESILEYNESDFCKMDNNCYLADDKTELDIIAGMKPKVRGSLKICNEATDAFLMAYYNGFPLKDVAWGKLNDTNWPSIVQLTAGYHNVTFSTKHVARDIARPLIKYLTNVFLNENTKVTLLMGHDANINVLLSAMSFKHYELDYNFISTPVGGKIVFQKWLDEKANEYLLKVEYVYQSNEQLRDGLILSNDNPPKFKLLELEHCKMDDRGFCSWDEFVNFLNDLYVELIMSHYLKIPTMIQSSVDAHKKWMQLLTEADHLVAEDADLQRKAAKGLSLKERHMPPEVLGRLYAQYCDVINRMYDSYLSSVHLQRAPYILDIVTVIWKRLYELRQELVHVIVNDYIYVDAALFMLKKTPYDIQIVVPYHFPLESRSEGMERLLQTMWADAERRKNEPELDQTKSQLLEEDCLLSKTELSTFQSVAKIPIQDEGESTEEFIQAVIIQKHERYRKFFIEDFNAKCRKRKLYFTEKNESKAPKQLKLSAALLIQKVYRSYMRLKREKMLNYKRDVLLGILPDPARKRLVVDEANNKIYERRRKTRKDMQAKYMKEMEREKSRLVVLTRDNQIDDITEHVMEWFKEWYEGYGFFPQFPYETEGGTVMVIREDYPYIEEKIEEDEKLAQLTKGKTKEMLTRERKAALEEAKMREELAKEQKLKEAEMLFKQRCNPLADPGYKPQQSQHTGNISEALQKYRAAWSIHDRFPDRTPSTVYGYLQSVLTEELMSQLHVECRKFVDELMRLDLKLLIKMQQLMYKRIGQKFPKLKPRKKPAVPKPPKSLEITDRMLQNIQVVFGLNIISKPTAKIKDIYGDLNYKAYEQNIADPNAKFPPPAYGDIRRRLTLSCVFGSGIEPGAVRNKAVMLLGPERHGKSFMVDAVCGELNAVKIDISPEVTSAVVSRPAKVLSEVLVAARVFQPAVIYMRNVERVFLKKVPPENRYLKAKKLKRPLIKLLKQMSADDKIIFIATCSNPFVTRAKPMLSLFREVLLVPRTDYASLQSFFFEGFQRIRSMPRDYCVSSLAQVLQGYGFGVVLELIDKVMTAERIVRLNVTPFSQLEFLEPLIEAGIEAVTLEEYQEYTDFFIANSPLRKEREEYDIINKYRASLYEKIFKDEQKKLNA